MLETLEDLRELRHRHARVDTEKMLQQNIEEGKRLLKLQEEEDEEFVRLVCFKCRLHIFVMMLSHFSPTHTSVYLLCCFRKSDTCYIYISPKYMSKFINCWCDCILSHIFSFARCDRNRESVGGVK